MGKRLMVVLMVLVAVLASCSKDSVSADKLSAKIDGKSWNAAFRITNLTNNIFMITGTSITGEVLIITINGDAPDTYELGVTGLKCSATYKKSALATSNDIYESVKGNVKLTKVDKANKKISGTFDFSLTQLSLKTVSISGGSFTDLGYTETGI